MAKKEREELFFKKKIQKSSFLDFERSLNVLLKTTHHISLEVFQLCVDFLQKIIDFFLCRSSSLIQRIQPTERTRNPLETE